MPKLTKMQKKILKQSKKTFPHKISIEQLLCEINLEYGEISLDLYILEKDKLITLERGEESNPQFLTITPEGEIKLQETILTKLSENAWNNPWPALTVIFAIISIVTNVGLFLYTSHNNENYNIELNQIKGELAEYEEIIANNSTFNSVFVPCPNGTEAIIEVEENGVYLKCVQKSS